MSQPYLGQIEAFPYNFAPKGWAFCAGQLLSIQQNTALFSLLGTTYGGNGVQTFGLPDLRGRIAMGQGSGTGLTPRVIGELFGEQNHTVLYNEMPMHTHPLNTAANSATANNVNTPSSSVVLGNATGKDGSNTFTISPYAATPPAPTVVMAPNAITMSTGNQPHPNTMPYLVMQFCIALQGVFPSRG
ncbi:phage tail protein [Acidisphaera sp. S103]|uniref:phage tail protein n=1 Tax=Acidisphaera sp. S103 TaxID=1747223 RepID=UPI00131B85AD|nr:tail fiber protein [Acidisphaera sp. S103]